MATGSALALSGGTTAFDLSLSGASSALALTGGTAFGDVALAATGSQITLAGGTAYGAVSLAATGSQIALAGGTATFVVSLGATGGALVLTGGEAAFQVGSDFSLDGTGAALTLTGGVAEFATTEAPASEEQPTGGWAPYNAAAAERQRRRALRAIEDEEERERQELADRLEAVLVAEGTLRPVDADLLRLRGMAAQYADGLPNRARRALAYAERAQTEMATQLAMRELARLAEEEEYALLLILAAA